MKRPGDPCKLTCLWWDGIPPEAGDCLRTTTGRTYQILEIKGKSLHCVVLAKDAPPRVYSLYVIWYLPPDFIRLGAYDERGQYAGNQVELARIRVR